MGEVIQQVQKRMLVSLASIAKDLDLHEGDHLLIEVKEGGIFLKPVAWHDKSQEYFWTKEWQEKMKASKEALEQGEYTAYNNVDDLLRELDIEGDKEDADSDSN